MRYRDEMESDNCKEKGLRTLRPSFEREAEEGKSTQSTRNYSGRVSKERRIKSARERGHHLERRYYSF